MSLLSQHDALLLDLDGTVWKGGEAIDGAVETINDAASQGITSVFITNNASRAPQDVATKLGAIGIQTDAGHVLTSAQAAVSLARQYVSDTGKAYVVGAPSFKDLAQAAGFTVVDSADENPDVVLHGHYPETGWAQLTEAALSIQRGARYIASNLDTTLPMERGLAVGNGSLVAAVTTATGVRPASAGKPEPEMFFQAQRNVSSSKPLAVGDRLNTDIEGAVAAKIAVTHVMTGVSGPMSLVEAPKEQRPTYLAVDMRDLYKDPAYLKPGAQGGFTARVDGDNILLEHGTDAGTPMEALRTVLQVAWAMPKPPTLIRPMSEAAARAAAGWW